MDEMSHYATKQAKDAKNWQMLEQLAESKADLARLEHEIKSRAKMLRNVTQLLDDLRCNEFICDTNDLVVLRENVKAPPAKNEVGRFSWDALDTATLRNLLTEYEESKRAVLRLTSLVSHLAPVASLASL